MSAMERVAVFVLGVFLSAATLAQGADGGVRLLRERAERDRPELLVIGSGHLSNPGRDTVNIQVDDVLAPRRQKDIEAIVARLAAFRPTHIAVEWPSDRQADLDAHYQAFRSGSEGLSRREADQLGLRLAARLNLPQVIAVDWNGSPPGDESNYDWPAYGNAHGQTGLVQALLDPARSRVPDLGQKSLLVWLRELNSPQALLANHRAYFDIARVGDSERQVGANWVGHWYARNLRIFDKLVGISSDPRSRVLVIYGYGHAYLLTRFAEESGAFRVADPRRYLK
jgi:hypothetical protein